MQTIGSYRIQAGLSSSSSSSVYSAELFNSWIASLSSETVCPEMRGFHHLISDIPFTCDCLIFVQENMSNNI